MSKKLNCIVLIDDDEPTNFLHQLIIERYECTEQVIVFQHAREALRYISELREGSYLQPDLILLDINMPEMNGWEFMDAYAQLPAEQRGHIVASFFLLHLKPVYV